jgi:inorganic pyrophosphatase
MDKAIRICPITQKRLEDSCPTCNFVIIESNKITGCVIRRRVLSLLEAISQSETQLAIVKQFKDEILNGN